MGLFPNSGGGTSYTGRELLAWVNFNGQGVVAIRDSYNVASITDLGTGQYKINFSSALPDANYCSVFGQAMNSGVTVGISPQIDSAAPPTTTYCQIQTYTLGGSGHDFSYVNAAFFS